MRSIRQIHFPKHNTKSVNKKGRHRAGAVLFILVGCCLAIDFFAVNAVIFTISLYENLAVYGYLY